MTPEIQRMLDILNARRTWLWRLLEEEEKRSSR